jgi:glyoxalase-like protein
MTLNRRQFLLLTAAATLARRALASTPEVPNMLDHILLGSNDLNAGINFVEERTGVRAAIGGVHPGRGTRNALLSLGERQYLEIIAPDPGQDKVPDFAAPLLQKLKSLSTPRLVDWAEHLGNLEALAAKLKTAGIIFNGPRDGSRARPDGHLLKWRTLNLADDRNGILPFFIEWDPNSVHPSVDAPQGCTLERFSIADPDPIALAKGCAPLGLDVPIDRGEKTELRARIRSAKGLMVLTS